MVMSAEFIICHEDSCKQHGFRRLAFFSSALSDRFTSESDVYVLVEFDSRKVIGLLGIATRSNGNLWNYWAGRWTC